MNDFIYTFLFYNKQILFIEQIDEYVDDVFGKEYSFIQKSAENKYVYEDYRGVQFTVEAMSNPVISFYSEHLPLYRQAVIDDYRESTVMHYKNEIETLAESNGLKVFYFYQDIWVIINNEQQYETASKVISEIDNILKIDVDYSDGNLKTYKPKYLYYDEICLSLETDTITADSYITFKNVICNFEISNNENDRWTPEKVLKRIRLST